MTKILHIDASARNENSVSRELSRRIVDQLGATSVTRRDLANPLPFLDETWVGATFTAPEERSAEQNASLALSDEIVAEVVAADTIVIGTAMYNFNLPASFKAWIDMIGRVGVTFRYTENGPEGLLKGKKVIIAIASGGTPLDSGFDHASPYLRFILGFMGITDVTIVDQNSVDTLVAA